MRPVQLPLLPVEDGSTPYNVRFPSTRFQGSKRKFVDWIWANIKDYPFDTVLDVFGGTGSVSHSLKAKGKQVIYNDILKFNWQIGLALIQNSHVTLSDAEIDTVITHHTAHSYPSFIHDTFHDIYFTDVENGWLDRVVYNIDHVLENPIKQALARFALFQACIIKRPYNLFHRANLYMRNADVTRSFGNKVSWDTPFEVHFRNFVAEANAAVFDNHKVNQALNLNALETPIGADLVYLDPPYLNAKGIGVDYHAFYHFLEGLVSYDTWSEQIDYRSRHRRLKPIASPWNNPKTIAQAFEDVIARHQKSILVISYRDNGIPTKSTLVYLLGKYKQKVVEASTRNQYALSTQDSHELLLIGL